MSLVFAADGDLIAITSGSFRSVGATGTIIGWFYLTDAAARQYLFGHNAGPEVQCDWRADAANDIFNFYRQRGTTYLQASAHAANFAAYALNKWLCIAFTWDTAGTPHAYMGSLTQELAAPSAYSTQTAGSGTLNTTAVDFRLGNGQVTTREMKGRLGAFAVFDTQLTLAQCQAWQFRPGNILGCLGLYFPGSNGTTSVPDLSGNGAGGTVGGAPTVGDFLPLGLGGDARDDHPTASSAAGAYSLALAQGSYALNGQTVTLRAARTLALAQGSYALTGQAVGLRAARTLSCAQGSYAYTGQAVGLYANRLVTVTQGAYALTGQTLTFALTRYLACAQGSYVLTGQSVSLTIATSLTPHITMGPSANTRNVAPSRGGLTVGPSSGSARTVAV